MTMSNEEAGLGCGRSPVMGVAKDDLGRAVPMAKETQLGWGFYDETILVHI